MSHQQWRDWVSPDIDYITTCPTCPPRKQRQGPNRGRFWLRRITIGKKQRLRAKLKEVNDQLKRRRHQPSRCKAKWLRSVVQGHLAYYAVPGNTDAVEAFRAQVARMWFTALRRRSQRTRLTWYRDGPSHHAVAAIHPRPAPFPQPVIRRQNPRQEPSAHLLAGLCGAPPAAAVPTANADSRPHRDTPNVTYLITARSLTRAPVSIGAKSPTVATCAAMVGNSTVGRCR